MSTRISTHSLSPEAVRIIKSVLNLVMLALSVMLIAYISYNTFNDIPFLTNRRYMNFQFWVCMVFILDFFIGLWYAEDKGRYFRRRLVFLLLSIPYLNIINQMDIHLSADALYFVRFIPLARGALALSIVIGYLSSNAVTSLFMSYIVIMLLVSYFCSLIFFQREQGVNPEVTSNKGTALLDESIRVLSVLAMMTKNTRIRIPNFSFFQSVCAPP